MGKELQLAKLKKELIRAKELVAELSYENKHLEKKLARAENVKKIKKFQNLNFQRNWPISIVNMMKSINRKEGSKDKLKSRLKKLEKMKDRKIIKILTRFMNLKPKKKILE